MPRVEPEAAAAKRREPTILLVDDEAALRGMMREILEDQGYTVFEAGSGAQALEELEDRSIDLLVVDHGLPGQSGSELVAVACKAQPGLRVLYISGHGHDATRDGGHSFLAKPFATATLVGRLRELLGP